MGHAGKADYRRGHGAVPVFSAAVATRLSMRCSHRSPDRSVLAPVSHSDLKCAYSIAQVGSSCTSVTVSSGGRPLGRTRSRSVKDEGPHLQSELICAEP